MSDQGGDPGAAQELPPAAEVVLSSVHLLITVGFERTGLRPGTQPEPGEVELCVEGVRALLPLLERLLPADALNQYKQALAELQLAYAEIARPGPGGPSGEGPSQPPPPQRPVEPPPRPKIWTPRGDV